MKKLICSLLFLCLIASVAWGNVRIDGNNFPDDMFRQYISEKLDTDNDGELSDSEIAIIDKIEVSGKGISRLDGIEYLTSLNYLDCSVNLLTQLDISSNTELTYLLCTNNQLTKLNVLDNKKLIYLACHNNQITELNTKNNTDLITLYCANNQLTSLDVSNHTKLKYLECGGNPLTKIDVSHNTELYEFNCDYDSFATLDLSNNKSLSKNYPQLGAKNQVIPALEITKQSDTSYPYRLNFSKYMSSDKFVNIVGSSVKGIDQDGNEIKTVYENGIAKFQLSPARVKYNYMTGFNNFSMDVKIGSAQGFIVSLNNHVYRLFTRANTWTNAKNFCESLGGHLITINNDEEKNLAGELIKLGRSEIGSLFGIGVWVGGKRTNNTWHWVTNEDFNVTVGNIDNENNGDYLLLIEDGGDLSFEDMSNSVVSFFICEWESVKAEFAPLNPEYVLWSNDKDAYYSGKNYGVIPSPIDFSHLSANPPTKTWTTILPSAYDPRTAGRKLPPVKNQNPYGTCWSFGSIGALEASYIAQFGSPAPNLSELHQAWFVYMDPRLQNRYFNKYKFKQLSTVEEVLGTYENKLGGGHSFASIAFLSRAGTAYEKDLPYANATNVKTLTANKYPENYKKPLRLKDAYQLGVLDTSNKKNDVKQFVLNNGAVAIAFHIDDDYLSNTHSYFRSSSRHLKGSNHIVQIVGWDDNYSITNFNSNNMPKSNGAWLIKNSYGSGWENAGYAWISYEEYIDDVAIYVADRKTGGIIYGYDCLDNWTPMKDCNWGACIFKANNDEPIREVAFHTLDNNISYEIYVMRHGTIMPNKPEIPSYANTTGIAEYAGYHTIALSQPLEVNTGDYFSVIVHLKQALNSSYNYFSSAANTGISSSQITIAGESYFANSINKPQPSDWYDAKTVGAYNACIKAFTAAEEVIPELDDYGTDSDNIISSDGSGSGGGGCEISAEVGILLVLAVFIKKKSLRVC